MNAPIVRPLAHKCTGCGVEKPLTAEHFAPRPDRARGFRSQCRSCKRNKNRGTVVEPEAKHDGAKACELCCGMAHRVTGPRCRRCKLLFADLPPIELVLKRYVDPRSGF